MTAWLAAVVPVIWHGTCGVVMRLVRNEKGDVVYRWSTGKVFPQIVFDDVVDGVVRALDRPAEGTPPHRLYNLGNNKPEKLTDFIATLEQALQRKAVIQLEPIQPGDVPATYADISASQQDLGFAPSTSLADGIPKFVDWYKGFYGV